jgi:signal transduction histidine kinase
MADADERVLCLTPIGRDAALTAELLAEAGIACFACATLEELCREYAIGAAGILLAEEVCFPRAIERLRVMLAEQPPWSDIPIVVFTAKEGPPITRQLIEKLGNVTLLERPVRRLTMVSAVRAMLRARRRQYQAREEILQQEIAVQRRDEFLAMLGHELRNPLSAVGLALEMLEQDERNAPKYREIIRRQSKNLGRLVDDLLDVSRVVSGKVQLHPVPLDLAELVQRAFQSLEASIANRQLEARFERPPEPVMVTGDALRLEQVVVNLVTNAIKYTPAGGHLRVIVERSGDEAIFRVIDDGVGIAEDMLAVVFELFAQVDRTLDRSNGGLGIGLTLVRSLVELHGGRVEATSEGIGKGTTISVTLPLDAHPVERSGVRPSMPPSTRAYRVLVVEDNDDAREMLCALLSRLGHTVIDAADGAAALTRARGTPPDALVIDIGLPGIDGYEVARRVRAEHGSAPFLVAMTGYGQPEDRQRAHQAGFDLHLTKPVNVVLLGELFARPDLREGARAMP